MAGIASPFVDPALCTLPQVVLLAAAYLYAVFRAASLLGDGGALLLLSPRLAPLAGAVLLPLLGAAPDAALVLASGVGAGRLAVGLGALAGGTVALLTLPAGAAIIAGRVALRGGAPAYAPPAGAHPAHWTKRDAGHERGLLRTGVGYGAGAKTAGKAMIGTLTGYLLVQIGTWRQGPGEDGSGFVLAAIAVCVFEVLLYVRLCWGAAQARGGDIDEHIADANIQALQEGTLSLRGAMSDLGARHREALGGGGDLEAALLGRASEDEVRRMCRVTAPFFGRYAAEGRVDFEGFRLALRDMRETTPRDVLLSTFGAADSDGDGRVNFEEFASCLAALALRQPGGGAPERRPAAAGAPKMFLNGAGDDGEDDGADKDIQDDFEEIGDIDPAIQQQRVRLRAYTKIFGGLLLLLIFVDPTVSVLVELGARLGISPFYVAFLLVPPATCSGEVVAAYSFAGRRTRKSMTTSLSTLECAAIINNSLCLGILLVLVYVKSLAWKYSAQTIPVVVVELAIGMSVVKRSRLTLLDGLVVLALYPAALLLTWALQIGAGLD